MADLVCSSNAHAPIYACILCQPKQACTIWKTKYFNCQSEPRVIGPARTHAQMSNTHPTKKHMYVPQVKISWYNLTYIEKLLITKYRFEWMKGICLIWSRGRHFSPSLPGDRYLKLGSKSDPRAEILGTIVWYDALAPRPEVLRSFSCIYGNLW